MVGRDMVAVNGAWVPNPANVEYTYSVLDKYAERSLSGKLTREIAAKKRKWVLTWPYAEDDDCKEVWDTFAALQEYANFTLPTPDGTMATVEGYVGADTTATMLSYWDTGAGSKARWKNLKISIIER